MPAWQSEDRFFNYLFEFDDIDFHGSQFDIGIVRGSTTGGDWGVSFVRKNIADTSTFVDDYGPLCFTNGAAGELCGGENREAATFQNAYLNGVQAHRFLPFATFRNRAQIGLTLGGGAGWYRGRVTLDQARTEVTFGEYSDQVQFETLRSETEMGIEEFARNHGVLSFLPLAKVEITGALIVARGFKIKAGGGFNYPGYNRFSVAAMYLFGGH